jgi:hypothetical protein
MAVVVTAIEARYFPKLDPERLHLNNAEVDQWQRYRESFDPVAISAQLGYSAADARQDAEWLLMRAHRLDPVGDSWSQLMRRAPSTAWKQLKDAALSALDYRMAAEILLLFYEDLAADPSGRLAADQAAQPALHCRRSRRQVLRAGPAWYHCGASGHGLPPRDGELGVAGATMSPGLARMSARAGVLESAGARPAGHASRASHTRPDRLSCGRFRWSVR